MDIITVASGALIANGLTFGLIWQLRKLDQQEPNHKAGDLVILIAIGGIIALIGIVAQRLLQTLPRNRVDRISRQSVDHRTKRLLTSTFAAEIFC